MEKTEHEQNEQMFISRWVYSTLKMLPSIQNREINSEQEVIFYERLSYGKWLHGIGGWQLYSFCQRGRVSGVHGGRMNDAMLNF